MSACPHTGNPDKCACAEIERLGDPQRHPFATNGIDEKCIKCGWREGMHLT